MSYRPLETAKLISYLRTDRDRYREALFRVMPYLKMSTDLPDPILAVMTPPAYQLRQEAEKIERRDSDIVFARCALASTAIVRSDPQYEYRTTQGPRKAWDGEPDLTKEGWEQVDFERFSYHEEKRWRRPLAPDDKDNK